MKTFLCFVPVIAILWNAIDYPIHIMWPWHVVMLLIFGITGSTMAFFVRRAAVAAASGILILAAYIVPFSHLRITSLLFMSLSNPIFLCIPIIGGVVLAAAFMIHTDKASPKLRVLFLLPAATIVSIMILSPGIFFSRNVLVIILFFTGIAACTVTGFIRYLRNSSVPDDATEPADTSDFSGLTRNVLKMILGFLLYFLLSFPITSLHDNINHIGEYAYVDLISTWTPPEPLGLENWIDHAADGFAGGTGTSEDPFLISTPGQLAYFAKRVNAGANWDWRTHFKISNDIDLAGKEWTPIGNRQHPFSGRLDGGETVIHNLTIASSKDFQGLIGYIWGGRLQNLTLVNVDVKGRNFVGGLVGAGRVFISNSSVSGTIKGRNAVGGLIGHGHVTIEFSFYLGNVKGHAYIGGLVGRFTTKWLEPSVRFVFYSFMDFLYWELRPSIMGTSVTRPHSVPLEHSGTVGTVSGVKYVGGIAGSSESRGRRTRVWRVFFAGKVEGEVFYAGISGFNHRANVMRNYAFLYETTGTEFRDRRNTILGRKNDDWHLGANNGIIQLPSSKAENVFLRELISSNRFTEDMLNRLPQSFRVFNVCRAGLLDNPPLLFDLGEEGYRLPFRIFPGINLEIDGKFLKIDTWRHSLNGSVNLPRGVYVVPSFKEAEGNYEMMWILLNLT